MLLVRRALPAAAILHRHLGRRCLVGLAEIVAGLVKLAFGSADG